VRNYQLIPPSRHPTGVEYEWVRPVDFGSPNYGIYVLADAELERLLGELGITGGFAEAGAEAEGRPEEVRRFGRRLSDEEIKGVRDLLLEYYVPGHRDKILFSLLGVLIKAGVDYESSRRLVELLATEANDEEARQRLYLVDYHYGKRVDAVGVERLRGVSGLREELEAVLRERGLSEDEVARRVSETLTQLYSTLGLTRVPHAAWLKRGGGTVLEWVYAGRQGVYLFKRRSSDDSPVIQIVSNAVIRRVREVRIRGAKT